MLTLEDISNKIGGTLEGNPKLSVDGPSEPKEASDRQDKARHKNKKW